MRRWQLVTHPDFPIWTVAHRIIGKETLSGNRRRWLIEAPDYVQFLARRTSHVISVEPLDEDARKEIAA